MNRILTTLTAWLMMLPCWGQLKISQYPKTNNLAPGQLFIVTAGNTNMAVQAVDMPGALGVPTKTEANASNAVIHSRIDSVGTGSTNLVKALTNTSVTVAGTISASNIIAPFSIVHLPDLQMQDDNQIPHVIAETAAWISANKAAKNIKLMLCTGDISLTTGRSNNFWAWSNAMGGILADIPIIITVGNHDTDTGQFSYYDDGRDTTNWNSVFGQQFYTGRSWWNGGFYTNSASDSLYCRAAVAPNNYVLAIGLSPNPRPWHYAWASNLCNTYSNDTVVLLQHVWMVNQGWTDRRFMPGDYYVTGVLWVYPEDAWQRYVQFWPNLRMISSGHNIPYAPGAFGPKYASQQISLGRSGNPVLELMHNYQDQNNILVNGTEDKYHFQLTTIDLQKGTVVSSVQCNTNIASAISSFPQDYNYSAKLDAASLGMTARGKIEAQGYQNGTNGYQFPEFALSAPTNMMRWSFVSLLTNGDLGMFAGTNYSTRSNALVARFPAAGGLSLLGTPGGTFSVDGNVIGTRFLGDASYLSNVLGAINVKAPPFNAKGDGINNDAFCIQKAINSLDDLRGGAIYIPAGTYKLSVGLYLYGKNNVRIFGDGKDATILTGSTNMPPQGVYYGGTNDDPGMWLGGYNYSNHIVFDRVAQEWGLLSVDSTNTPYGSAPVTNILITDLTLQKDSTITFCEQPTPMYYGKVLYFGNVENLHTERVAIVGGGSEAFEGTGSTVNKIRVINCDFRNNWLGFNFNTTTARGLVLSGCHFEDCDEGILLCGYQINVANNIFRNIKRYAMEIGEPHSSTDRQSGSVVVANNVIEYLGQGSAGVDTMYGIKITVSGPFSDGQEDSGNLVIGNTINRTIVASNQSFYGIYVGGSAKIIGNYISGLAGITNNDLPSASGRYAYYVAYNGQSNTQNRVVFENNTLDRTWNPSRWWIGLVVAGNTNTHLHMSGNKILDGLQFALYCPTAHTNGLITFAGDILNGPIYQESNPSWGRTNRAPTIYNYNGEWNDVPLWGNNQTMIGPVAVLTSGGTVLSSNVPQSSLDLSHVSNPVGIYGDFQVGTNVFLQASQDGGLFVNLQNNSANSGAFSRIGLTTLYGTSGDAFVSYNCAAVGYQWALGMDTSDGYKFKLTYATGGIGGTPSSGTEVLSVTTNSVLTFPRSIICSSNVAAASFSGDGSGLTGVILSSPPTNFDGLVVTNKVGIGTNSPTGKVQVIGITSTAITNTDDVVSAWAANMSAGIGVRYNGIYAEGTSASHDINIQSHGGYTWIGTGTASGGMRFKQTDTGGNNIWNGPYPLGITADAGYKIYLCAQGDILNGLTVNTANERIGIGTTNPVAKLQIFSDTNAFGLIVSTPAITNAFNVASNGVVSGNGSGLTNIGVVNNTAFMPAITGTNTSSLPTPVAGFYPILYATDALTSQGTGAHVKWNGSAWKTFENVTATSDAYQFLLNAGSVGLVVGSPVLKTWFFDGGLSVGAGGRGGSYTGSGYDYGDQTAPDTTASDLTTSNGVAFTYGPRMTYAYGNTGSKWFQAARFALFNTLGQTTNAYYIIYGDTSSINSTYPGNGHYFLYDMANVTGDGLTNGHWACVGRSNSVSTVVDSGISPVLNTYRTMKILSGLNTNVFYIDNTPVATNTVGWYSNIGQPYFNTIGSVNSGSTNQYTHWNLDWTYQAFLYGTSRTF